MPGSGGSAEMFGEEGFGHEDGMVGLIECSDFRSKNDVDAFLFAKGQIFFEGLWVRREIFRAIKLGRVDEDRDGNRALRSHHFASCSNQGEVAPMKRTHRRHQG